MVALWIILGVVIIFTMLLMLRVGMIASYDESGGMVLLRIGPFRYQILPATKEKKKKKPQKPKKKKTLQAEEEEAAAKKRGGALSDFRTLLRPLLETLGKLKRKLRIEVLELTYISGASDPAKAAIAYGAASAGLGMLASTLEYNFHIQNRKFRAGVDFTIQKPVICAHAALSLRVGQLLSLGIAFGIAYLKENEKKKQQNEVKSAKSANPV